MNLRKDSSTTRVHVSKSAEILLDGSPIVFLKTLTVAMFLLFTQFTLPATANSESIKGGGGDVIIMPNDDVVLADPFLDHGGQQPGNMPPLRTINPRILQAVSLYAKASVSTFRGRELTNLMEELSNRKNSLRFYAVRNEHELDQFCAHGGRKTYKLPDGATVQSAACTAGNDTFLVEPLFIRLTIKDQALLLIHERLTTLTDSQGGRNYSAIARFTTGLKTYLTVVREQSFKKYRKLSQEEADQITEFYVATEEIEKRNSEVAEDSFMYKAHINGGGKVHLDAIVSDQSFVSLRSKVGKKSIIAPQVQILNSVIAADSTIEEGSLISNSPNLVRYQLERNVTVDNLTTVKAPFSLTLGTESKVESLSVECEKGCSLYTDKGSHIKDTTFKARKLVAKTNVKIINCKIYGGNLNAGNSFELINSTVAFDSEFNTADNLKINDSLVDVDGFEIGANGELNNIEMDLYRNFVARNNLKIENTWIKGEYFQFGNESTIKTSTLVAESFSSQSNLNIISSKIYGTRYVIGSSFSLARSEIDTAEAVIGDNQKLEGGLINASSLEYAPVGFKINTFTDSASFTASQSERVWIPDEVLKKIGREYHMVKDFSTEEFKIVVDWDNKVKTKNFVKDSRVINYSNCMIHIAVKKLKDAPPNLYLIHKGQILKAGLHRIFPVEINWRANLRYWEEAPPLEVFDNAFDDLLRKHDVKFIENSIILPYN